MNLSDDEQMAGGLANAVTKMVGEDVVNKLIAEMPAQEANDTQRIIAIGKLMEGRQ